MAASLVDKLRAARRFQVTEAGHAYTLRRPTDAEVAEMRRAGDVSALDLVRRYVVGWDHTELSLGLPGGGPEPATFDADLWAEWVADQPALWAPLSTAILDAYSRHDEARSSAEKN